MDLLNFQRVRDVLGRAVDPDREERREVVAAAETVEEPDDGARFRDGHDAGERNRLDAVPRCLPRNGGHEPVVDAASPEAESHGAVL